MQSWDEMREAYLEWMRIRNYSLKTVNNNEKKLKIFAVWALERGLNSPSEITKAILERYQRYLYNYRKTGSKHGVKSKDDNKPLSVHTQMGYLSALRSFFRWAARQNLLLYNPASEIDLPRPEKRLPKHILNEKEVEQILSLCDIKTHLGLRDRAIIETLYSTGMRRMELLSLKIIDIDNERGTVHIIQGKGKKDRTVPIGERACLWVQKYINESRPNLEKNYQYNDEEDYLFLGIDGQQIAPYRLSEIVRTYIDKADIGKSGSCHLLRHTCATHMLEHGADIRYIQQLLGHEKLSTTQIYTQVSIKKLKNIHTLCHPAKIKK